MLYYTIDGIVRSTLLQINKPIHYYLDCLVHARECFRELSFDDLKIVNTTLLTVNTNGNYVDLPCSYVDFTKVGIRTGQMIRPLVEYGGINRLHNYDSAGAITTYTETVQEANSLIYKYPFGLFWGTTTIDDYGEFIGRLYGWGAGFEGDTFKVIPERNQIQLNESITAEEVYLEYISDGCDCNSASQVPPYATATITAYIIWKLKCYSRSYGIGDIQMSENEYLKQRQILRARKDGMTIDWLKRMLQRNYTASPRI